MNFHHIPTFQEWIAINDPDLHEAFWNRTLPVLATGLLTAGGLGSYALNNSGKSTPQKPSATSNLENQSATFVGQNETGSFVFQVKTNDPKIAKINAQSMYYSNLGNKNYSPDQNSYQYTKNPISTYVQDNGNGTFTVKIKPVKINVDDNENQNSQLKNKKTTFDD